MFEQIFKNLDNVLREESGCATELDYTEQSSWLLFLRYLDELEKDKADKAILEGKNYTKLIKPEYQWSTWAAPKLEDGTLDRNKTLTDDDLIDFVNQDLFPYLRAFRDRAPDADTLEYKIGEIFDGVRNKFQSGYLLRDALDLVDKLQFRSQTDKHELSHLYEVKIKNMGNAGRNGGEYYTPRPLIRTLIKVINPQIGETIYDGAAGSAGFLCEAYEYLNAKVKNTDNQHTLQKNTFYAKEVKGLAYIIGIMNMILHGIETPNIIHTNTLNQNIMDIGPKDQYDIILANPPFGGRSVSASVQQNFPIRSGEPAFLFLQHFMKSLKPGGRAAVVIKNTFLSNGDAKSLRKELLETCNLHTVLDCPAKTFLGAGVKTVVLFFEKGAPTQDVWFYQLDPGRSLGKTNPLNDNDLKEFIALQKTRADSDKSWKVKVSDLDKSTFDLSVKNPNTPEAAPLREPQDIIASIVALDDDTARILTQLQEVV